MLTNFKIDYNRSMKPIYNTECKNSIIKLSTLIICFKIIFMYISAKFELNIIHHYAVRSDGSPASFDLQYRNKFFPFTHYSSQLSGN